MWHSFTFRQLNTYELGFGADPQWQKLSEAISFRREKTFMRCYRKHVPEFLIKFNSMNAAMTTYIMLKCVKEVLERESREGPIRPGCPV